MITNDAGRKIIMDAEGCRLEAYKCPAGVWTIGYGHTGDVKAGQVITQHQAEVILEHDLQACEFAVGKMAPQATGPQFSALVSLAFNIGTGALERSRLMRAFRQGAILTAAAEFLSWNLAAGKVLPGLVKRRAAERKLFLQGVS